MNALVFKLFRNGVTKSFRIHGVLQDESALEVVRAMESAAENKMALEQCACRFESFDDFFGSQVFPQSIIRLRATIAARWLRTQIWFQTPR